MTCALSLIALRLGVDAVLAPLFGPGKVENGDEEEGIAGIPC